MAIKIVTDSSCDLPKALTEQWGITVVPCYVITGDQSYKDGVDLSADAFYAALESNPRLPTTAQPSVADFQEIYRDLIEQGHQVVSIHVSGKLSGTINSATQARSSLGDAAAKVEVVDSQLASIPLGLLVCAAAQDCAKAASHLQVAEQARRNIPLTTCYFMLDTLEYLQKGGRIGKAQAFLGSVLNVKPILTLKDGEAHPLERPRNRARGLGRLLELITQVGPLDQLAVIYSTELHEAEAFRVRLSGFMSVQDIVLARFGPTLGTYLGPRALGVAFSRSSGG